MTGREHTREDPTEYVVAKLRDALARDPRVGELELEVEVTEDTVVIGGMVGTEERRRAITEVVQELVPHCRVDNRTEIEDFPEPGTAERLP